MPDPEDSSSRSTEITLPPDLPTYLLDSEVSTHIYLYVVQQPEVSWNDLTARGYSADDIEQSMSVFEARQLVRRISDDVWSVNAPDRALTAYAARLEERAKTVRSAMPGLNRLYQQGISAAASSKMPFGVEVLQSLDEINVAMHQLFAGAQKSVVAMRTNSPRVLYMLDEPEERHNRPTLNQEGSPLQLRVTFDSALLSHKNLNMAVDARTRLGDQVRFYSRVPFTATVADEGTCVVDINDPDGSTIGLRVTHPGVSHAIRQVIDGTWQLGTPWVEVGGISGHESALLDERDREILRLLTLGSADATIARQLNISQRTVERRVRRLMDVLDASTRFQAGIQAAKRDWV